ncbi:MAG: peptidoglycan-associated lipoprotein Pal [Caulobacterales bacterium]
MTASHKTLLRLAVIALAAASLVACESRPKPAGPVAPTPQTEQAPEANAAPGPGPVTQSQPTGPIPGSSQDFVINVGELVYFDTDQYVLRSDATPVLDAQAAWLNRYPAVRVRIEGNCDERGTREYNFALGARRADTVKSYLIAHGVSGGRIETISYGKERPIDPGSDEKAWARNRNGRTAITQGAR